MAAPKKVSTATPGILYNPPASPSKPSQTPLLQDLSGRPHLSCNLQTPTDRIGSYDTQLVEHFFQSLVNTSGMTLHIRQVCVYSAAEKRENCSILFVMHVPLCHGLMLINVAVPL